MLEDIYAMPRAVTELTETVSPASVSAVDGQPRLTCQQQNTAVTVQMMILLVTAFTRFLASLKRP